MFTGGGVTGYSGEQGCVVVQGLLGTQDCRGVQWWMVYRLLRIVGASSGARVTRYSCYQGRVCMSRSTQIAILICTELYNHDGHHKPVLFLSHLYLGASQAWDMVLNKSSEHVYYLTFLRLLYIVQTLNFEQLASSYLGLLLLIYKNDLIKI